MAAHAVAPLQLQMPLLSALQQRRVVPGGSVEDCRRVRRRRHRPEVAIEFLFVHVLRLVHFQQELRAVPDNVCLALRRHEQRASPPHAHDVSCFDRGDARQARLRQPRPEPSQADPCLGLERRRALHAVDSAAGMQREQQRFQLRRELVLAALARHLDRETQPAAAQDAVEDRAPGLDLIWTKPLPPRPRDRRA